jgi:succinate-semialdehyde dehydrogenase/glutarate-semialdehyde dehydrogenase
MSELPRLFAAAGVDMAVPTDLLIGGEPRPGAGRIEVLDPSTGEPIVAVADAGLEDGRAAVEAAHGALAGWAATPPRRRAEILRRCFELMTARAEQFARLMSLENGKALPDARGEAAHAAEFFRWFSEEAVRIVGDVSMAPAGGGNRILVEHQPIGVSVLVTPWNFPAAMATR